MENVNKQLLDAAKALVSALNDAMPHMNTGHDGVGPDCTKQFQALIDGHAAIAAVEHVPLTAASSEDQAVYASIASNYHQPPAVAVSAPASWSAAMAFARSALAEAIQIAPLDRLPAMAGAAMQQIDALLVAAPQAAAPLSAALADIAAERRRQMEVEGWTPEHDDAHSDGQMATAAACYAISAHNVIRYKRITMPSWWPWDSKWWKPTTARRDLVKAGALIAAEIERLDRAAQKGAQ